MCYPLTPPEQAYQLMPKILNTRQQESFLQIAGNTEKTKSFQKNQAKLHTADKNDISNTNWYEHLPVISTKKTASTGLAPFFYKKKGVPSLS